ncbi:MAG: hypothetical protein WDO19_04925 [Bacteroidota bacterium]
METIKNAGPIRPILSQTKNNTTLWIGHLQNDPVDHFAGQTFKCPSDGTLDNIQVYSSIVQRPGDIILTLHEFGNTTKDWKPSFASSSVTVNGNDQKKWLSFSLPHSSLMKDRTYGFRLQSTNAMIGIGELVRPNNEPCSFGQEWNADSNNMDGVFFTWFSLAFKVEMVA